jgi:uncharacterized membrane protein
MAGLFFGWSVSVIPGTARISDRNYVSTMQSINRAIVNPGFVITFLIPPMVLGGAAILHWRAGQARRALWLAVGAVSYLVGVLGVTFGGNVPLNNALDAFDLAAADDRQIAEQRAAYEQPWNRWHTLRAAASVFSLACAAAATLADAE